MPTLSLRFPGRRYHATPWGHHVNEGMIEWPPSPWRVLRALVSIGYTSGLWNSGGMPAPARSLVEKLAGALPIYRLPRAIGTHSRHYMPVGSFEKGREQTTLVFDAWAQVNDGELLVRWDVSLTQDEESLLGALIHRLGYLGRSESWVVGTLVADDAMPSDGFNCLPDGGEASLRQGLEQVSLLSAESVDAYEAWRGGALGRAISLQSSPGKNVTAKARQEAEAAYPEDLIACLQAETNWLRAFGWNQPPGSRRVFYWRPVESLEAGAPRRVGRVNRPRPVETMLLSLASASGNSGLLPPATRTASQAELLHRALVSQVTTRSGQHSPVLTGCDKEGQPLRGTHEHAHVLPIDLDEDGHLDHVLIWARMGLDADAQDAVRAIRRTFTKGGDAPLRLALAGSGTLESFRAIAGTAGDRLRDVLGPNGGSTAWVSATPFVPPRFLKKSGRNTLPGQITAELSSRGLPAPIEIHVLDPHDDDRARRQRHFIRARRFGPRPPIDAGFTIALRFAQSVSGPLCLGYGAHFGLGRFQAE